MKPSSSSEIGLNRTGIGASPFDGKRMMEASEEDAPTAPGNADDLHALSAPFLRDAPRIGSVPPPATLRGATEAAIKAVKAEKTTVFIDLLGERLAFERTGTRLYESVIARVRTTGEGPPLPALETIRREELRHVMLLDGVLRRLGADPSAMTPAADISAVATLGILRVVTDPRATLTQVLHAVLIAELADDEGWSLLIRLAEQRGDTDLVQSFVVAREDEERHVQQVREWHARGVLAEATFRTVS